MDNFDEIYDDEDYPPFPHRLYIKDDEGMFWYFEDGRIILDGDDSPDAGYACRSIADGYRELIELGYITEEPK